MYEKSLHKCDKIKDGAGENDISDLRKVMEEELDSDGDEYAQKYSNKENKSYFSSRDQEKKKMYPEIVEWSTNIRN